MKLNIGTLEILFILLIIYMTYLNKKVESLEHIPQVYVMVEGPVLSEDEFNSQSTMSKYPKSFEEYTPENGPKGFRFIGEMKDIENAKRKSNEASSVRHSIPSISLVYILLFYIIVHQFETNKSIKKFGVFEILLILSIFINIWMKFKMDKLASKWDESLTPDEKEYDDVYRKIKFTNIIVFILFLIVCHHQNMTILWKHKGKYITFLVVLGVLSYMYASALASVGHI